MVCRGSDGRYRINGIISWGREDCIHDDHPSVLTKVSSYREWINTHVQ
jgi:secreted trypsin-like serine protease